MSNSYYVYETQYNPPRTCETCKQSLSAGYVLDNGVIVRYYCDNDRPTEYDEWYEKGMAWWTDWIEEGTE